MRLHTLAVLTVQLGAACGMTLRCASTETVVRPCSFPTYVKLANEESYPADVAYAVRDFRFGWPFAIHEGSQVLAGGEVLSGIGFDGESDFVRFLESFRTPYYGYEPDWFAKERTTTSPDGLRKGTFRIVVDGSGRQVSDDYGTLSYPPRVDRPADFSGRWLWAGIAANGAIALTVMGLTGWALESIPDVRRARR